MYSIIIKSKLKESEHPDPPKHKLSQSINRTRRPDRDPSVGGQRQCPVPHSWTVSPRTSCVTPVL